MLGLFDTYVRLAGGLGITLDDLLAGVSWTPVIAEFEEEGGYEVPFEMEVPDPSRPRRHDPVRCCTSILRCYTATMPTTKPRYTLTDTGKLSKLLDDAQRRWPDVHDRKELLLKLAAAGGDAIEREALDRRLARQRRPPER